MWMLVALDLANVARDDKTASALQTPTVVKLLRPSLKDSKSQKALSAERNLDRW